MNIKWPKHKPEATLHEIVSDGVARDFDDIQIIEETNGIADSKMIALYRESFNNEINEFYDHCI